MVRARVKGLNSTAGKDFGKSLGFNKSILEDIREIRQQLRRVGGWKRELALDKKKSGGLQKKLGK